MTLQGDAKGAKGGMRPAELEYHACLSGVWEGPKSTFNEA